jgi:hypothetical protein
MRLNSNMPAGGSQLDRLWGCPSKCILWLLNTFISAVPCNLVYIYLFLLCEMTIKFKMQALLAGY